MSKVTQKGQVLIPKTIREKLHIVPGKTEVAWEEVNGRACLVVVEEEDPLAAVIGIAKGKGLRMTADEIMDLSRGKDR